MTQLFRAGKPTICSILKNYSNQRYQQNHYETLKVSSGASQEDIKRAFLKLSKQLHPDISGRCSHTDFVKLNEAYSILGKASTRRKYDEDLKYKYDPYMYNPSQNRQYKSQYQSQWEYEVRTAGGIWPPSSTKKPNTSIGLAIALLFFGLGLFQLFFMMHSMKVRKLNQLRSMQLEHQYYHIQKEAHNRTSNTHQLNETNINEILTEDSER
ncbi:dnaJ homolog subfamily C member 4-like [Odontomachus brunneus]|uniref:dnaJ homolog subfamily C member 4-like n=1 Tax=Odontomachus brunneus TaxID=486640 RepID=UPI0013F298D1|nr:dnaJ homolog subfamily C member 4-like [Odontomachus brunneus]